METHNIIIDYLKIFISTPFATGLVSIIIIMVFKEDIKGLISRIAKIKLPGGSEFETSQKEKEFEPIDKKNLPKVEDNKTIETTQKLGEELNLTPDQIKIIQEAFESERANAYLWEYKYLNYFLVPNTKNVLDWFYSQKQSISVSLFDNMWKNLIPDAKQREIIIAVLVNHYLLYQNVNMLEISPKGREYKEWREKI